MSTETQRAELPDLLPELMKLADAYAQAFNKFGSSTYNPRTASERAFLENNLRAAFAQASQATELAALKADIASEQATEIEARQKDAERLDALEAANFNSAMWLVARGKDSFTVAMKSPYGNCVTRRTLREAIDAAMQTKEAS